jgi:hypothetical protein
MSGIGAAIEMEAETDPGAVAIAAVRCAETVTESKIETETTGIGTDTTGIGTAMFGSEAGAGIDTAATGITGGAPSAPVAEMGNATATEATADTDTNAAAAAAPAATLSTAAAAAAAAVAVVVATVAARLSDRRRVQPRWRGCGLSGWSGRRWSGGGRLRWWFRGVGAARGGSRQPVRRPSEVQRRVVG